MDSNNKNQNEKTADNSASGKVVSLGNDDRNHKGISEDHDHNHEHGGPFGKRSEFIFSLLCGLFLLAGYVIERWATGIPEGVSLGCYIAAFFFGGYYTLKEAIQMISKGKFEIDFLMLVAAAGAA